MSPPIGGIGLGHFAHFFAHRVDDPILLAGVDHIIDDSQTATEISCLRILRFDDHISMSIKIAIATLSTEHAPRTVHEGIVLQFGGLGVRIDALPLVVDEEIICIADAGDCHTVQEIGHTCDLRVESNAVAH